MITDSNVNSLTDAGFRHSACIQHRMVFQDLFDVPPERYRERCGRFAELSGQLIRC
jgi:hypothetical protein